MRRNRGVGEDSNGESGNRNEKRVELKYCERCGGLWLRECGVGEVYCDSCQRIVADLPVPKKKPQRLTLPVGQTPLVERYAIEDSNDDPSDFGAMAGGAA